MRQRPEYQFDRNPISSTFTRKIIHCKRCGSRVVSNVSHCPYCGKNLLPIYQRLVFWIIMVLLMGAATTALIYFIPTIEKDETRTEVPLPVVVGSPEGASFKNLVMGTTVDCNSLLVTVVESSRDLTAQDGSPITKVIVQFLNKGDTVALAYSTQWQVELSDGTRLETSNTVTTSDGENLYGDLKEPQSIAKGASLTVTLYFKSESPYKLVFAPDVLAYTEQGLVTWVLPQPEPEAGEQEDGPPDDEPVE